MNIKIQNEINYLEILKTRINQKHQLIKREFKKHHNPEQIIQLFNDIKSIETVAIKQNQFLKEYEQLLMKYNKTMLKYH